MKTSKLVKPIVIQFPVNDICNSRCQMCQIWKQKKSREITPQEIANVFKNPLFSEARFVGINGGEPTLRNDLTDVVGSTIESLSKIEKIFLITNALESMRVSESIRSVANVCHDNNVKFDVMVSLDGVGQVHDRVRGRTKNFDSVVRVLDFLQSTGTADSIRIGCTVIKENVYGLEDLLDWCIRRDIRAHFRLGIPHRRLYNLDRLDTFKLSFQEKFHFANFLDYLILKYEKNEQKRAFYKSLRNQIIYNKDREVTCLWQSAGITLNSRAEIAFCAVESDILGNALTEDSEKIFWDSRNHLAEIRNKKCKFCYHDYGPAPQIINKSQKLKNKINKFLPISIHRFIGNAKKILKSKERRFLKNSIYGGQRYGKHINSPKILICGWYGTETLGDKAILGGLIQAIQSCGNWEVDIASLEPYVTQNTKIQMPELKIGKILNLSEARYAIQKGDYKSVIMGGGPLMGSIRECHDILDLLNSANQIGATTVIACCGVGPLGESEIDSAIGEILNVADFVMLRDSESLNLARKKLGIARDSKIVFDPAFFWTSSKIRELSKRRKSKQILLALRDLPVHEYALQFDHKLAIQMKENFENELRSMIKRLLKVDPNLKIIPFCMHKYARGGDDRFFYRRVFANFPEVLQHLDDCHRAPEKDLEVFATSQSVLAMRYHSLVFAISSKTPVIAVDYSFGGKVAGLLEDLKATQLIIKLNEFSGEDTANRLLAVPPGPPVIKGHLAHSKRILHQTLKEALK